MSALYEGCWHKLDRAKKHLDELDDRIGAWTNLNTKPPYGFGKKFDAKREIFTFHVVSVEQLPVEWSLIAGDALTNFRAALDYLAQDLIGHGSQPRRRGKSGTQFTIGLHCKEFNNDVAKQMPGITKEHRTLIEGYQPYDWGDDRYHHPFARLRDLVNRDKHRELQLAGVQQYGGKFRADVVRWQDFAVHGSEPGSVFGNPPKMVAHLKPGAEVARVFGKTVGPNPDVDMSFQAAVTVTFEGGAWLMETLEAIGVCIAKLFGEVEPTL